MADKAEDKPQGKSDNNARYIELDMKTLLIPVTILLSTIILSTSMLVGLLNIAGSLKGGLVTTGTTTASPAASAAVAATTVSLEQVKSIFDGDYIKFGDSSRELLFVEFSDPSCPYCHLAAGDNPAFNKEVGGQFLLVADGGSYVAPVKEMRKLVDEGKASFAWIYTNGHGNGELATQALYCAQEKGKFWAVHELLMNKTGYDLINDTVKNDVGKSDTLASFLEPAIEKSFMNDCLTSKKYAGRISSDMQFASSVGVSGTPGFFINEKVYAGAYNWTDMKGDVDAILK